jgi:hypothetical protein
MFNKSDCESGTGLGGNQAKLGFRLAWVRLVVLCGLAATLLLAFGSSVHGTVGGGGGAGGVGGKVTLDCSSDTTKTYGNKIVPMGTWLLQVMAPATGKYVKIEVYLQKYDAKEKKFVTVKDSLRVATPGADVWSAPAYLKVPDGDYQVIAVFYWDQNVGGMASTKTDQADQAISFPPRKK